MGNKDGGRRLRTSECRPPASHNQRTKRSHRAFVKTGNLAPAIGHAGKVAGLVWTWVAMATAEPGSMDQHGRLYLHTHTRRADCRVGLCI